MKNKSLLIGVLSDYIIYTYGYYLRSQKIPINLKVGNFPAFFIFLHGFCFKYLFNLVITKIRIDFSNLMSNNTCNIS